MEKEERAPNGREAEFLRNRNHFADIPEDESNIGILRWNTSYDLQTILNHTRVKL